MRNFINLVESVGATPPQVSEGAFSFMRSLAGKQAAPVAAPDNNPAAEPATSQPTPAAPVQPVQPTREQEQEADRMMTHIARNLHGAGAVDSRFAAGQIRELSRLSHILKGSFLAARINTFMQRQASKGLTLGSYTFQ